MTHHLKVYLDLNYLWELRFTLLMVHRIQVEYKSVFDFSIYNVEQWGQHSGFGGATGFWIQNSTGSAAESVMSGEVITDAAVTNTIAWIQSGRRSASHHV